jgi:hypothetical protein
MYNAECIIAVGQWMKRSGKKEGMGGETRWWREGAGVKRQEDGDERLM